MNSHRYLNLAAIKAYVKYSIFFPFITILLGFLLALGLGEIIIRSLGLSYSQYPYIFDPIFHHLHIKNYRFIEYDPNGEFGGHPIFFDESGFISDPYPRTILNKGHKNNQSCRVAFLGDSFTEALQVAYEKTFVGSLEKTSNGICEIRNFGTFSYSPIFYLLQWNLIVKQYKPTHVIVLLYSNDIASDNFFSKHSSYQNGELVAIPGPPNDWLRQITIKSDLIRFLGKSLAKIIWKIKNLKNSDMNIGGYIEENPNISEVSSNFMIQLFQKVHHTGANFSFMVVPSKFRLFNHLYDDAKPQFSDKWKKWAKQNKVPFIDLVKPFEHATREGKQLFFSKDIHFNEAGHLVVAQELKSKFPNIFPADIP